MAGKAGGNMIKRIVTAVLLLALLFSLTACAGKGTENGASEAGAASASAENSAGLEDGLKRRGTPVLGYMNLPIMHTAASYNADKLPINELRSEYALYTYNVSDYPTEHPDDALLVKMERYYLETVENYSLDNAAEVYGQYESFGDDFESWAIEDRTVDGHAAKLVKFETAQKDMGICLTGDHMYRYIWVDEKNTDCFVIQFIWNPGYSDYDVEKYISSYSLIDEAALEAAESTIPESAYEDLLQGDFSHFSGVWRNGDGESFTLNPDGSMVSGSYDPVPAGEVTREGSYYRWMGQSVSGFIVELYPIGVDDPFGVSSDITKLRIFRGQADPMSESEIFYLSDVVDTSASNQNVDIGDAKDFLSSDGTIFDMLGYLQSLKNMKYLSGGYGGFTAFSITLEEWDSNAADGYWSINIKDNGRMFDLGAFYEVPYTSVGANGVEHDMYLDAYSVGLPPIDSGRNISGDTVEFEYESQEDFDDGGNKSTTIKPGSGRICLKRDEFNALVIMLQRINDNPTLAFDPLSGFEHNVVFRASITEKGANLSGYEVAHEGTVEEQFYYYGVVDTEDIFNQVNILRYQRSR